MIRCVYCGLPADGNFSIHRDGFGVGPEVPLCDACGGHEEPTLMEIWERISTPSTEEFSYVDLKSIAAEELQEWFEK